MLIQRYENLEYEQLQELEKELYNKIGFKPIDDFRHSHEYSSSAEKLNNYWKKNDFWAIVKPNKGDLEGTGNYFEYIFPIRYPGKYKIPLNNRLNEDLKDYLVSDELWEKVTDLIHYYNRNELVSKMDNTDRIIQDLQMRFQTELYHLADLLKKYIEKHSVFVHEYEPYFLGCEDGRRTKKMIELIGDVESAYRGIVRGSKYAYYKLQKGKYIKSEYYIDELYLYTTQINVLAKKYLAYQMAVKYSKENKGNYQNIPDVLIREVIYKCIIEGKINGKKFISSSGKYPGKIKPNTIATYLSGIKINNLSLSRRGYLDRVKDILPTMKCVEISLEDDLNFIPKKRKNL